jgi:signal transduction histidine kinase
MDDQWLNYTAFCKYLRNACESGAPAFVGGDEACRANDCAKALEFLEGRLAPNPGSTGAEYACHMGLRDYVAPIRVAGKTVGIIFGGQRRPDDQKQFDVILRNVDALGGPGSTIAIGSGDKATLKSLVAELPLSSPALVAELEQEADRIAKFASERRGLLKINKEDEFIRQLRIGDLSDDRPLDREILRLLQRTVEWCGLDFACIFVTEKSGEKLLKKVLSHGLTLEAGDQSPHFNWPRAALPTGPDIRSHEGALDRNALSRGLRGGSAKKLLPRVAFAYANALEGEQRAVLCLGRRRDGMELDSEAEFLVRLANRICHPYLELCQYLELKAREEQWEDAASLIGHQVRGSLNPITTETDIVRRRVVEQEDWISAERVVKALDTITAESEALAAYSSEALDFWHWIIGRNHRKFEMRSFAELVNTCVERVKGFAERERIDVRLDPSVALLPKVEVIGRTIEVAIRNVLENAIKYSFDERFIEVRGAVANNFVELEIEDYGIGIPEMEREKVFQKRYRGEYRGRKTAREGEGLGAWQAAEIMRAHGGTITCTSRAGDRQPVPGSVHGFRTIFVLRLPVEQKYRSEDEK